MEELHDCRPRDNDVNLGSNFIGGPGGCETNDLDDPRQIIRREILRQLREEKYFKDLNERWDKSTYRMKKDELFRRMQMEKNEKDFQDCLCKKERATKNRHEQICQEEAFARAMREMKDEEVRESAFSKQLYACSPEIRELERQLRRGYYAKTLYAQRLEGEALKLEEKMRQQEGYEMLMDQLAQFDEDQEKKRRDDWVKKKDYFKALTNQLEDATSKMAKKQAEFSKDKTMVDEIIAGIQQEEMQDWLEKSAKVQLFQNEIDLFLKTKEEHKERERNRNRQEDEKIKEYLTNKEQQVAEYKKAKDEQDKAKASIVAKAIDRIMKEQFKHEELEELRQELYEEELAEQVRNKELEELAKKHRHMLELRQAAEEAKKLRAEKLAADKKEEEEYRKQLMDKFAEDERLEQMADKKRRQKERDHRKVVEQMIIDRRCLKAQEREREQQMLDCFDEETNRRESIIAEERIKLLKKHGPKVIGFLPRGIIKSWDEIEKLGEPFISYYKNQPLAPDPSTIDVEPCEEEIFKTMEMPQYARY